MDEYLFSLNFMGFSRINKVMSRCIDFHYSLYYRDDFHPLWHVNLFIVNNKDTRNNVTDVVLISVLLTFE